MIDTYSGRGKVIKMIIKDRIQYKTVKGIKEGRVEEFRNDKIFIATTRGGKWISKKNVIGVIE